MSVYLVLGGSVIMVLVGVAIKIFGDIISGEKILKILVILGLLIGLIMCIIGYTTFANTYS